MGLRCVNCGAMVSKLLVQYSPGNIRLMKCESCKAIADPYVECELMILFIDLVLHKRKAYRHLLFNMLNQENVNTEGILWKACLIYLISDMFRSALLSKEWDSSRSSLILALTCGKMLLHVSFGNFIFLGFVFLSTRFLMNNQNSSIGITPVRFSSIIINGCCKLFWFVSLFLIIISMNYLICILALVLTIHVYRIMYL